MPRKTRMRKSRKRNRKTVRRRNRRIRGGGMINNATISHALAETINENGKKNISTPITVAKGKMTIDDQVIGSCHTCSKGVFNIQNAVLIRGYDDQLHGVYTLEENKDERLIFPDSDDDE